MFQMNVPKSFWSQGILAATYIINRLPSIVLNSRSPYEVMKGRIIDLSHLRIFGHICFVHIQAAHRDKLEPRATKYVFMGYSSSQKGYKCYNPSTGKIIVSRYVRFDEFTPYFCKNPDTTGRETFLELFPLPTPVEVHECNTSLSSNDPTAEHEIRNAATESGATQDPSQAVVQPGLRKNPTRDRHLPSRF